MTCHAWFYKYILSLCIVNEEGSHGNKHKINVVAQVIFKYNCTFLVRYNCQYLSSKSCTQIEFSQSHLLSVCIIVHKQRCTFPLGCELFNHGYMTLHKSTSNICSHPIKACNILIENGDSVARCQRKGKFAWIDLEN